MSSVVIVAIPRDQDDVRKISSEKVPHLTLLFLGEDISDEAAVHITEFVEHAAHTYHPFMLDVDSRGTLGEDNADVLFFNTYGVKNLEDFRSSLLKDPTIKTAYDSNEQYPKWTPHLTLGYPESPAHKDESEYNSSFSYVQFDKIAIWFGDSEGPTFTLKHPEESEEVSMSTTVENVLAHYGKKGMRWGKRTASSTPASEVKITTSPNKIGKTKIKAKGGKDVAANPDAIKAKTTAQILKKSGTNSLSNKELQELATRLNLERQVKTLAPSNPAKKFAARLLSNTGKQQANRLANDAASKQIENMLKNK